MIPSASLGNIELVQQPPDTWRVVEGERIDGMIDGIDSVVQFVYFALNTERYAHEIYSWNWGVDFNDLYGQPADYAYPEIKRRIKDALMIDDRITAVEDFTFSRIKGAVSVKFTVISIYGEFNAEREVTF